MRKVRISYKNLTQSEFYDFLTYVISCLTDNAFFPALPEALDEIAEKQTDWMKELDKSRQGDRLATQNAKALREELASKIKKNGNYINDTANGNVGMLDSSGYTLTKVPEYQPKKDIKVVQGEASGTGFIVIEAFPNAICYLAEICADPKPEPGNNSVWSRLKMSSKCTIPLTGLEPRKLYWVRFCYLTIDGEADYCEPRSFSLL